jgi:Secretion system C-terminal sorting domain
MKANIYQLKITILIFVILSFTQAQYVLKSSVFSNGGAVSNSAGFKLHSIAGQVLAGKSQSSSNIVHSGFIATFALYFMSDDPLPVELLNFSVTTPGDSVILISFSTASEVNVAGFNILRAEAEQGDYRIIANYLQHSTLLSFGNSSVGGDYSWKDKSAVPGKEYWYKLQNIDIDGSSETFGPVYARLKELPAKFRLAQNYPNPFNPQTTIRYELPKSGRVRIDVFNLLGQKVTSLLNKTMPAGYHSVIFDATALPSGMYFYALQAGSYRKTRKMMLVK